MTDELDLFDELAGAPPDESPVFEELPAGAWCLGKTATAENGNAAARVQQFEGPNGPFHKFNVGLLVAGGDAKLNKDTHTGRMAYFDAFLLPGEKETHGGVVSGRLTGFLNCVFAPGVSAGEKDAKARAAARWRTTMQGLKDWAATGPTIDGAAVTLGAYGGDKAQYIASLLKTYLLETPRAVLFNTRAQKDKEGVVRVKVGSVEDYIADNVTKRKIKTFMAVDEIDEPYDMPF